MKCRPHSTKIVNPIQTLLMPNKRIQQSLKLQYPRNELQLNIQILKYFQVHTHSECHEEGGGAGLEYKSCNPVRK